MLSCGLSAQIHPRVPVRKHREFLLEIMCVDSPVQTRIWNATSIHPSYNQGDQHRISGSSNAQSWGTTWADASLSQGTNIHTMSNLVTPITTVYLQEEGGRSRGILHGTGRTCWTPESQKRGESQTAISGSVREPWSSLSQHWKLHPIFNILNKPEPLCPADLLSFWPERCEPHGSCEKRG